MTRDQKAIRFHGFAISYLQRTDIDPRVIVSELRERLIADGELSRWPVDQTEKEEI